MADEMDGLLRLNGSHVKAAALTLAKAFQDYPIFVFFFPDEAEREKRQPVMFRMLVRGGIKNGEVYATSLKMEGVAVWYASDSPQESWWGRLVSGQLVAQLFTDKALRARQKLFMRYAMEVRRRVVPPVHWYLQVLGVNPDYQGRGFAGKLLRPMLARADKKGTPCYLETQLEKNVPFYEYFGFRVVEEGTIPGSNVKSWAMVRGKI